MKFCCDSRKYYESLNSEDKEKFKKHFKNRTFSQMPWIWTSIWEEMTSNQRGAIWLDFTKVGRLLECDSEAIYAECLRADELRHIWLAEYEYGPEWNRKKGFYLRTLSQLSKDEMILAIPQIRDFLLKLTRDIYQNPLMVIYWSKKENIGLPDYEFMEP